MSKLIENYFLATRTHYPGYAPHGLSISIHMERNPCAKKYCYREIQSPSLALIIKTQLRHTHFLGPLVSFVPFWDNVWPHWVSIITGWRLSGVGTLWHIWFTLFG